MLHDMTIGARRVFARPLSLRAQRALYGYLFVSPWLIGFLIFLAWPLVFSFWFSFREVTSIAGLHSQSVGWNNYRQAFLVDVKFLPLFWDTLSNLLVDLPIINVFALSVALVVTRPIPGRLAFRVVFFMPVVIGSAWVVQQLFNQGVGRQVIFSNVDELRAMLNVSLGTGAVTPVFDLINRLTFVLWRSGVQILIFIAALHSIPPSLYEAARVDGGSSWGIFWKITLPMISPFILVNVIYTVVDSFTEPFNRVLTYIQQVALTQSIRLGYGAALGWLYFVAIFLILSVVLVASSRLVYYAGER